MRADSVSAQGVDPSGLDSLRGVAATAWVTLNGRIQNLQTDTVKGSQAGNVLRALYAHMEPRAKVGDHWTDTTEVAGTGGGGMLSSTTTKRVTNWAVTGEQMMAGVKARKVESAFSQSVSGQMNGPQGSMGIDGTGTGSTFRRVGKECRSRWSP